MNLATVIQLKYPNADFISKVNIRDDSNGEGPYISQWDESLGPKPTQADIDQWAIELVPVKQAQDARQSRRNEYPSIGDQLDALYKAMDAGTLSKVPEFYNPIKIVKDKYPVVAK